MITIPHGDGLRAATKIRGSRLILDLSFWKGAKLRSKDFQEITYPMLMSVATQKETRAAM
jgi:hypothetical protein